ncbi:hypothetical protein CC80DRAFT_515985 [Byssothecium circinans]|uniref:Purine and uridine phosphorylase n=1 Tax=Byssothecium circinans TaxID=147558 RepID=A0A6A5TWY5_9PLEO|nr:hypothetical protein CC80DRAFT_515985 [Byssothecium circinans]
MSDIMNYTVGWICAIPTEYDAAIGKHYIVITIMPDGEYGTSSAASIVRDMLRSFPNIRVSLMVGISSGALSLKHNIYLGDIIYNFSKTMQDQSIFKRKPSLRKNYQRLDLSSDRLYQSTVTYSLKSEANCAEVCGNDPSKMILQPKRIKDEDNLTIYYGLIASGNQVIMNASIQDALIRERDVLCFEIEVAGLMNYFPCLVVRGICDYLDSHRDKEW